MDQVLVVALVGMPGSGKSSCVEYLIKKGFPSVYFGGITLEEVKKRGLEVNEVNEKAVREDIRAKEGKDAYARRIIEKINALTDQAQQKIVADGLYSWSEYKYFQEYFGNRVTIIAIASPRRSRHKRLTDRPTRPLTEEEVNARDYAEIENIEKGGPIANADYTVVNDGSVAEMFEKLDQILKEINFIR